MDLKLFWAVSPADLNAAQEKLEHHVDSYTIGKNKATDDVTLLTHNMTAGRLESAGRKRAQHQIDLIASFKNQLPPFHATWSLHDGWYYAIVYELLLTCSRSRSNVYQLGDARGCRGCSRCWYM